MKILAADKYFSLCIRLAHAYTCEWCGQFGRMENSHVYSRRHRTIRWDKQNANCLCNGCHRKWHESPIGASLWFVRKFGQQREDILIEKMNNRVKVPKTEEKLIAKHYREQLKLIEQARELGAVGYVDFVSYQ